jgi:hypothetical protein
VCYVCAERRGQRLLLLKIPILTESVCHWIARIVNAIVRISGLPYFGSHDVGMMKRRFGRKCCYSWAEFSAGFFSELSRSDRGKLHVSCSTHTMTLVRWTESSTTLHLHRLVVVVVRTVQLGGSSVSPTKMGRETHGRAHAWSLPEQLPDPVWLSEQCRCNKSRYKLSDRPILHQITVRWCSWLSRQSNIPVRITEGLQFKSGSNHFLPFLRVLSLGEGQALSFAFGLCAAEGSPSYNRIRPSFGYCASPSQSRVACEAAMRRTFWRDQSPSIRCRCPSYIYGNGICDRLLWLCVLCVALHNPLHGQWLLSGGGSATV